VTRATSADKPSVLVAHGNAIFRRGLRSALEAEFTVRDAPIEIDVLLARAEPPAVLILVVDTAMRDPAGMARTVRQHLPDTHVVGIWPPNALATVPDAIASGVRGFVLKTDEAYTITEAVRAVCRGDVYLSCAMARYLLSINHQIENLTPRQRAIFSLVTKGKHAAQIADELNLSEQTVTSYLSQIRGIQGLALSC
jgi:DNA-binding NarL/FixJ family response regulator